MQKRSLFVMLSGIMIIISGQFAHGVGDREVGRMKLAQSPIKGSMVGNGITVANTEVKLVSPAQSWKGHWNAGQLLLPGNGRIVLRAEIKEARPAFMLQAYGGKMLPPPDFEKFENNLYEANWILKNSESRILSALWLTLTSVEKSASAKILELSVWQTPVKNKLDADRILATPPVHRAELKLHNNAMTLFIDNQPVTGQMWGPICSHSVIDKYLEEVLRGLDYPVAQITFGVGETRLTGLYPSSWLGQDEYDWSYIDTQARRILKVRPDVKLILCLALDGAKWWTDANPNAANTEVDADPKPRKPGPKGIPDYLSPEWRRQVRELLRQLVAHIKTSDWGEAVIGYELFNGRSMDCNFMVPHKNERVIKDFRNLLKEKYQNDLALQLAWGDPKVRLETALPWAEKVPSGIILEPVKNRHFLDTRELLLGQWRSVFSDFAAILKEATHYRALVGARTGDFFGNFGWSDAWFHIGEDSGWLPPLLRDSNFDYFDVQEPYPGRHLGGGAGVPLIPPKALEQFRKTVFIQNDVRTHLSKSGIGYGRTPDLESTISLQRRVFANALTYNMIPYLYQLDYRYNEPELLAEYRTQEKVLRKAATLDRSSVAEVAIVLDPEMRLYFGSDSKYTEPTRYFALLDFPKHVWQRAGAPFDMIFLDQIEKLPPYRVYIFVHTWRYTQKQLQAIREKVLKNGQCAVFLWADGLISDNGTFSETALSKLTGMHILMSSKPESWNMTASKEFPGVKAGIEVGTLPPSNYDPCAPKAADWQFEPSFRIESGKGTVPLACRADGSITVAMRREVNYTVIYSASGNLTAPIFKLALQNAGAFIYTDSSALLMMNRSYLAFHADKDEVIRLKLPAAERLTDLFAGKIYPTNSVHEIPVRKNHTYVFERQSEKR